MPTVKTLTDSEKLQVDEHLCEVLNHPSFRKSERSSKLLRFLVEAVLSDSADRSLLKERTLGHEVFGRPPDYDSNDDPVVRNAASEIRKRLAQYYQDAKSAKRTRIILTPGSYHPEFAFIEDDETNLDEPVAPNPLRNSVVAIPTPFPQVVRPSPALVNFDRPRRKLPWAGVGAAILTILGVMAAQFMHRSPADRFWGEVFAAKQEIIICAGPSGERLRGVTDGLSRPEDPIAVTMIAAFLKSHHKNTKILLARETSLDTMEGRPVVLVGALNNQWTSRLLNGLRYRIVHDGDWNRDLGQTTVDYAIVTRVKNPTTGGMVLSVGGLGLNGTEAAAQFVTDDNGLKSLDKVTNRANSNIQVILKTSVHKGVTGTPEIVAAYSW